MTEQQSRTPVTDHARPRPPKPTGRSRSGDLRKLLSRRNGATVAQIQKQLGWQPHTVRAAISRLRSSGVSVELNRFGKVARYRAVPGKDQ